MNCNVCQKKEAVVHYAEIVNGEMKKMDLCEACAVDKGVGNNVSLSMTDLLTGITDWEPSKEVTEAEICNSCQMTYADFKKTGRLGCKDCYNAFNRSLTPLLDNIHHSTTHVGKSPVKKRETDIDIERIKKLTSDLHEAVKGEEFEKAAMIRDEIKKLNKGKK